MELANNGCHCYHGLICLRNLRTNMPKTRKLDQGHHRDPRA
jgi:hypothetical protein